MARLIAATCPRCGAGVRIDLKQQFVTCSYCGVSSFIETPKRPATEQVRQVQPVIHVERTSSGGCLPSLLGLTFVIGGLAFAGSLLFGGFPQLMSRVTGATSAKPFNLPFPLPSAVQLPQLPQLAVAEDLFADPPLVKRRFEERLGSPVMVKELVLYPSYAIAEAQDPKNKQHLDRYVYRSGALGSPEPVRLSSSERDVNKVVFSLDQIAFDKLAGMIQSALKDLPVEEGKVTHVILTRDVFTKGVPAIRVYVNGPRDSGYVEYAANGKRGRVVH